MQFSCIRKVCFACTGCLGHNNVSVSHILEKSLFHLLNSDFKSFSIILHFFLCSFFFLLSKTFFPLFLKSVMQMTQVFLWSFNIILNASFPEWFLLELCRSLFYYYKFYYYYYHYHFCYYYYHYYFVSLAFSTGRSYTSFYP